MIVVQVEHYKYFPFRKLGLPIAKFSQKGSMLFQYAFSIWIKSDFTWVSLEPMNGLLFKI